MGRIKRTAADDSSEGTAGDPDLDPLWIDRVRSRLVAWYEQGHRALPWRADRDPYRILVSEMMLVQTTVAAVVPFFARFLARFPTVHDLAQADETDVLKAWEGLGYYRRARQLHAAARAIVGEHGGIVECESTARSTTFRVLMPAWKDAAGAQDDVIGDVSR